MYVFHVSDQCNACGQCIVSTNLLTEDGEGRALPTPGAAIESADMEAATVLADECPMGALSIVNQSSVQSGGRNGILELANILEERIKAIPRPNIKDFDLCMNAERYYVEHSDDSRSDYAFSSYERAKRAGLEKLYRNYVSRFENIVMDILIQYKNDKLKPFQKENSENVFARIEKNIENILKDIQAEAFSLTDHQIVLPSSFAVFHICRDFFKGYVLTNDFECVRKDNALSKYMKENGWNKERYYSCYIDVDYLDLYQEKKGLFGSDSVTKYCFQNIYEAANKYIEHVQMSIDADDLESRSEAFIRNDLQAFEFHVNEEMHKKVAILKKAAEALPEWFPEDKSCSGEECADDLEYSTKNFMEDEMDRTNLTYVPIRYPTLHNNMDKSYRLRSEDPLPDGVKEQDSIFDFLQRAYSAIGASAQMEIAVEVSPKLDGVSINGTIHDDMLIDPQSRGDVDESVAVIGMSGMQVNNGFKAETDFGIQYEAFCTEADRVAASSYLMEKGAIASPYVSCRHAAAGIVHRLSTVEDDNLLQFISLYPIFTEGLDGTYEERMDYIQNFGIVPKDMIQRKIIRGSLSHIVRAISRLYEAYETLRESIGYAIDGLVITVVSDEYQSTIGREGRTNKYQIALKFDPANAEAEVAGVHLDAGSKGFRTIQVDLKNPVFLDGIRYDHIPILSAELFDAMNLNHGCKVSVHRVGDVIPSISVVESNVGSWFKLERPSKCPFCGGPLTIVNKKLFCGNQACSGNIVNGERPKFCVNGQKQ